MFLVETIFLIHLLIWIKPAFCIFSLSYDWHNNYMHFQIFYHTPAEGFLELCREEESSCVQLV